MILYFVNPNIQIVNSLKITILSLIFLIHFTSSAQDRNNEFYISLFTGIINYQGDLKPNSFTFNHSNFTASLVLRKPITKWLSWRAGASIGRIEGADKYNRSYLKPRNLSFFSSIKEIYTAMEINLLDLSTNRITPYAYGGLAVFHFNPWTYDRNGNKVFLKQFSTEGQGLSQYPSRKPYGLTQLAIPFGVGVKYALRNCMSISVEMSQRKTFTDYLDDVSSFYVDQNILLAERGPMAVSLAYRGDELPNGRSYPIEGTIRGTPSEMDWYYFFGISVEMKLSCLKELLSNSSRGSHLSYYQKHCPSVFSEY